MYILKNANWKNANLENASLENFSNNLGNTNFSPNSVSPLNFDQDVWVEILSIQQTGAKNSTLILGSDLNPYPLIYDRLVQIHLTHKRTMIKSFDKNKPNKKSALLNSHLLGLNQQLQSNEIETKTFVNQSTNNRHRPIG